MAVSDDATARKFYGTVLGLQEFDSWHLPPPFSMKMYLFARVAVLSTLASSLAATSGDELDFHVNADVETARMAGPGHG